MPLKFRTDVLDEFSQFQENYPNPPLWLSVMSPKWIDKLDGTSIYRCEKPYLRWPHDIFWGSELKLQTEGQTLALHPAVIDSRLTGKQLSNSDSEIMHAEFNALIDLFDKAGANLPEAIKQRLQGRWSGNQVNDPIDLWTLFLWDQRDREEWIEGGEGREVVPVDDGPDGLIYLWRSPIAASMAAIKNCRLDTDPQSVRRSKTLLPAASC